MCLVGGGGTRHQQQNLSQNSRLPEVGHACTAFLLFSSHHTLFCLPFLNPISNTQIVLTSLLFSPKSLIPKPEKKKRTQEEMKEGFRYSTVSSASSSRRIGRRCLAIAKQQRTRFYILRRCISILLCWHAHAVRD